MNEAVTIPLVSICAAVVVAAFVIWWRIDGQAEKKVNDAKDEIGKEIAATHAMAVLTEKQLSEYKTHVAETYVSKAGHRESTEQLMGAINGIKVAIDGTNQRIDRIFENPPSRRSRNQSS